MQRRRRANKKNPQKNPNPSQKISHSLFLLSLWVVVTGCVRVCVVVRAGRHQGQIRGCLGRFGTGLTAPQAPVPARVTHTHAHTSARTHTQRPIITHKHHTHTTNTITHPPAHTHPTHKHTHRHTTHTSAPTLWLSARVLQLHLRCVPTLAFRSSFLACILSYFGSFGCERQTLKKKEGTKKASSTAVDFSVVHALQSSDILADVQPGKLARTTEQRKVRENAALCRLAGWNCCPFVLEAVGAWGGRTRHLTQIIACRLAAVQQCTRKEAALSCRGRISSALLRAVCRQLERGFPPPEVPDEAPRADYWSF